MKGLTNSQNYISGTTINNENITIIENGIYKPSEGYTGIGTATVNVPTVNNQDKTVTPKITQQTITADSGFSGLGTVTVEAVDSSIDSDITASNIVKGVNILGVEGTAVELNGSTLSVTPTASAQNHTPITPSNGFTSVSVEGDANLISENIVKNVSIFGVQGTYEGTPINNQDKTIIENGTYTADTGYTGLGTVTVEVPSSGGHEVTYTNLTNADIKTGDKLWINTTATTTEKASVQIGSSAAHVIQASNPNVAVTTNKLYTLQDGAYVQSSLAKTITIGKVGIDKNGLLYSSNALYDIENNIFYNGSFTSYFGNGYVYYYDKIYKIDIANIANILNTYSIISNKIAAGWCFEDGFIIGLNAYANYLTVRKLNSSDTFEELYSKGSISITPIGQFNEQKIGWGLKGNNSQNLNLGAYRYSRNGDDVNIEEIPATEFPEDMRPMFTEQPSYVFWNEQTLTLTASWASTTPNKVLIFKYINGEWVNKTPIISEFVSGLGYITCDSSVSKIIVSGTSTSMPIIYDGNEKSAGYYAVPYLYSRKESLVGKAQSDVAINQTGKAATILVNEVQ